MAARTVGVLHPGEMGAALAAALRGVGHHVLWVSDGRSDETRRRAEAAGLEAAGSTGELARRSDFLLSVCPPHAAVEVARSVSGFEGIFVDANAVSPATAREIAGIVEAGGAEFVDGGIVGRPPRAPGTTRLYLSGDSAATVAGLFAGTVVDTREVSDEVGAASALKMAYAAWTKGTAAMLIAIRDLGRTERVEAALAEEWRLSLPDLPDRLERALASAEAKGWRWVGEMEEIASTFSAAGLPGGFHEAAAEVFRAVSVEPERK